MERLDEWIEEQLRERGWRPADLARIAGIPNASLSRVLNQTRGAGADICNAIAKAFGESPEKVFRLAGLLPPVPEAVEHEEEAIRAFRKLPSDLRMVALRVLRSMEPGYIAPVIREDQSTYSVDGLEREIEEFAEEFPELESIIEEARARGLNEQAMRALMLNVRTFKIYLEAGDMSFRDVHTQLSNLFGSLTA